MTPLQVDLCPVPFLLELMKYFQRGQEASRWSPRPTSTPGRPKGSKLKADSESYSVPPRNRSRSAMLMRRPRLVTPSGRS
jgi:hypothetical protein